MLLLVPSVLLLLDLELLTIQLSLGLIELMLSPFDPGIALEHLVVNAFQLLLKGGSELIGGLLKAPLKAYLYLVKVKPIIRRRLHRAVIGTGFPGLFLRLVAH